MVDAMNTNNNNVRIKALSKLIFKPAFDYITRQREGFAKLEELLVLTTESVIIRVYQKTGSMNWEAFNNDILDRIVHHDEDRVDDAVNRLRGLALD